MTKFRKWRYGISRVCLCVYMCIIFVFTFEWYSLQCERPGFDPWAGKIPWRRTRQPTPVFLPGESHGQRSLLATVPMDRLRQNRTWLKRLSTVHMLTTIPPTLHWLTSLSLSFLVFRACVIKPTLWSCWEDFITKYWQTVGTQTIPFSFLPSSI